LLARLGQAASDQFPRDPRPLGLPVHTRSGLPKPIQHVIVRHQHPDALEDRHGGLVDSSDLFFCEYACEHFISVAVE
jgi:hypothetical protein